MAMKSALILAVGALLALLPDPSAAQAGCETSFQSHVAIDDGVLTLGDLLEPGACGALGQAARSQRIGRAPLPGSMRVLSEDEARALFDVLRRRAGSAGSRWKLLHVPERIVIRRRGVEPVPSRKPSARNSPARDPADPLTVRAGEAVTLVWDEDGIRLAVPAVSLDGGQAGEPVRARIGSTGRVMRATIWSAGILRAAL